MNFPTCPQRIISLVPSQTELLFDLGLDAEIVGITQFCIHPVDKVNGKAKIGGTKTFNLDKIKALQPDLILGNKEENYQAGIEALEKLFPVWISDIFTPDDAYEMMLKIGALTGRETESEQLVADIKAGFDSLALPNTSGKTCAYFIWRRPYMVAASDTFIHNMLPILGLQNVFAEQSRYPEISIESLAAANPDFIFLSTEPYSFTEKHIEEFQAHCPRAKVVLVDGELFSWYGSRMKYVPAYFKSLRTQLGI